MGELFSWWLVVEMLGAAGLPLAALLFARLPDRGWALAKPLALLVTGWLIWFPLSLVTSLPYNRIWLLATFLFFALGTPRCSTGAPILARRCAACYRAPASTCARAGRCLPPASH